MMIPLDSLCVAAALADGQGKVVRCNDKFQTLVYSDDADVSKNNNNNNNNNNREDGKTEEDGNDEKAIIQTTTNREKSIWELVNQPKGTVDESLSSSSKSCWSKTMLLWQGATVPSKWVRAHISIMLSPSSSSPLTYLLQLEDVDSELRAKDQWSAILETTFDGFWDYHIDKDYEYMSPRFWEMFGYQPHEKQHKPSEWMDMVHPQDFQESMKDLQAHFESKGQVPYQRETRYKHKNGQDWIWVNCRGKVIEWHPETGAPLRMVGTHTDITESKRKQEREAELLRVEERYKAEQQLQDFVAHEIRNPLAAAMSATQFLQEGIHDIGSTQLLAQQQQHQEPTNSSSTLATMKEDVNTVAESLDYIHQLLTSMLDLNKFLTKGGSGSVQLSLRAWRLKRDVLEPVAQLYKHRAHSLQFTCQAWYRNSQGHLELLPPDKDEMIHVDMLRLKQILINLISNAIKFTKEGFVRVQLGRFQADKPNRMMILVEDSGPGVAADKRNLLFEKYVQLNTQVPGSGIGLALTKLLVQAMNGTIEFDESYQSGIPGNPGSRFAVELDVDPVGNDSSSIVDVPEPSNDQTSKSGESKRSANSSSSSSPGSTVPSSQSTKDSSDTQIVNLVVDGKDRSVPRASAGNGNATTPKGVTVAHVIDSKEDNNSAPDESKESGQLGAHLRVLVVDDDRSVRKLLTRRFQRLSPSIEVDTADSGEVAISKIKHSNSEPDLVVMDHYMPLAGGQLTGEETIRVIRPFLPNGVIVGSSGNDVRKEHTEARADLFWLKPVPKDEILVEDLKEAFRTKRQQTEAAVVWKT
mmetsp:Transcript_9682/g.26803  ORF Transcript_9682/g.26803 Transcript_9682/m.26803 type:complete len:807 (-) Transcript_9682:869-3289(-)